jgi:hypothetical protein
MYYIGAFQEGLCYGAEHVACMEEMRKAYSVLVGKSERKRPLGKHRHRWEDNIRIDLCDIGCDDVDWINLAQDRGQLRALVDTIMNLRVP